jgi:hypothetical protein
MPEILDFAEALANASATTNKQHILLGNGFSIACRPDAFRYDALLDEATFDGSAADITRVFELLGTTDFERVIEVLELSSELATVYGVESELGDKLRNDANVVRDALARVLAARHPDLPYEIEEAEYKACRTFLGRFERIYTLNYDMLLYWAVMQDLEPDITTDDGFRAPEDEDATYVEWDPYATFTTQRLFYLHGSLHLYDSGNEISKITWSRTGIPLVDQIREALSERRYPLIVTEGSSEGKEEKILHNAYLNHAIRSFSSITGALFIHGHSLAANDDHILTRIVNGRLSHLYVSVHGDPESARNRGLIERAANIGDRRGNEAPLTLGFYDADSAAPWG